MNTERGRKVRFTTKLDPECVEMLDELSGRMQISKARLIESWIRDEDAWWKRDLPRP